MCGSSYNQHCSAAFFGKPLLPTKLAQHPSLPCALLRIFSHLNPFSELLSLFPCLSAFFTIPLSLSFCHYSPLSQLLSLFPSLSASVTIPLSLSFCDYSPLSQPLSLGKCRPANGREHAQMEENCLNSPF